MKGWIFKNKLRDCKENRFLLVFLSFFVVLLFFPLSSQALVVSPARVEFEADPGEVLEGEVFLVNDKEQSQTFYSSMQSFEAGDESGVPKFVDSKEGLVEWIDVQKEVTLEPGKRVRVPFKINVPQDAGTGGHFAAIFWGNQPVRNEEESGVVSLGAKVGSLVFLRVKGEIIEKGKIVEFHSISKENVFNNLPVDFLLRFENQGNDRLKPEGKIRIYNSFGQETDSFLVNKTQGSVLPGSIRRFFVSWGREDISGNLQSEFEKGKIPETKKSFLQSVKEQLNDFHLGKYTAVAEMEYGIGKNKISSKFSFYLFPWQLLLVAIILLLFFTFIFKFGLKRYHKRIIRKYADQEKKKE